MNVKEVRASTVIVLTRQDLINASVCLVSICKTTHVSVMNYS